MWFQLKSYDIPWYGLKCVLHLDSECNISSVNLKTFTMQRLQRDFVLCIMEAKVLFACYSQYKSKTASIVSCNHLLHFDHRKVKWPTNRFYDQWPNNFTLTYWTLNPYPLTLGLYSICLTFPSYAPSIKRTNLSILFVSLLYFFTLTHSLSKKVIKEVNWPYFSIIRI